MDTKTKMDVIILDCQFILCYGNGWSVTIYKNVFNVSKNKNGLRDPKIVRKFGLCNSKIRRNQKTKPNRFLTVLVQSCKLNIPKLHRQSQKGRRAID